jgi:hypothetical protein
MSASQIKASYESNADTNAFTNALLAKLNAISGTNTGDQDLSNLVVKVTGKGLSTEDYTTSEKNKLASLTQLFLGKYTTTALLQAAHPTALPGQYADVDSGSGDPVKQYNWDDEEGWVLGTGGGTIANTDALVEGATNKYFTTERARQSVSGGSGNIVVFDSNGFASDSGVNILMSIMD